MYEQQDPGSAADGSSGISGASAGEARLQTFGALVVLDAVTLRGRRYTEAALELLGCDAQTLLGESFGDRLTRAVRKVFTAFQQSAQKTQETALPFPIFAPARRRKLPVCLHRREGLLLVELLPGGHGLAVRRPPLTGETMARVLASSYRALGQADDLQELCQCAATLVQTRLGFARAAVLRYEPSGAARTQATAEGAKKTAPGEPRLYSAPALPIALGATGIPHQLVMLADADSPSVELVPSATCPVTSAELVGCLLHAPSPACVQQVRALGGRAMLAVRIEQPDGRAQAAGALPWGLILCWDPRPQVPSAAARALVQSLADQFCSQLGVLQRRSPPGVPRVSDVPGDHRRTEHQKLDSLGVLAAGIAHDFNNLLTGILGNASLLRADSRRGRHTDSYLTQIEETSLRAAELCKQMLAYAGQGQFSVRPIHLNTLIADSLPLLDLGPSPRPAVQLQLASALPVVRGDVEQLRQVLGSLLRNAAEALPINQSTGKTIGKPTGARPLACTRSPSRPGPPLAIAAPLAPGDDEPITVSTSLRSLDTLTLRTTHGNPDALPGEYVALEVRDTGCGITAPVQTRMFEPFFTTKRDARGLGLSTVIGIVRAHGGVLLVHSEPDRGSTFTVFLPVCKSAGDCAADAPATRF